MTEQPSVMTKEFKGVRVEVETPRSFDEVLDRLRSLTGRVGVSEIIAMAQTAPTAEDYSREIDERFVGKSGFMLFSEIDHGGWISRFGIKRRAVRWILGNPLIAITMMRHDISAGLFAPVEFLLAERSNGTGSVIFYFRPSTLIAIDGNPDLLAAARALDAKLEDLIERAARG